MASLPFMINRPLNNPIALLQDPPPRMVAPLGPASDAVNVAAPGSPSTTSQSPRQASPAPVLAARDSSNGIFFDSSQAADQKDVHAQEGIGVMARYKCGFASSDDEGIEYFQLAKNKGAAHDHFNLGLMYERGLGVLQSDDEAIKHYRLAAGQGHGLALRQIGTMYRDGKGVPCNEQKAMRCFWKANKPSIVDLSCLRITGNMLEHLPDLFEEFDGYGQTKKHPPITRLDLSFNPITDIGAPFIAHILKRSQTLTELDLQNTNFTGPGVEPMYTALKYFNVNVVYGAFEYGHPMFYSRLGKPISENWAIKKIIDGLDTNYPTFTPKPSDILPMDISRQLLQTIAEVHIKNPASRKQSIDKDTCATDVSKPATVKQLMDEVYIVLMSGLASESHTDG